MAGSDGQMMFEFVVSGSSQVSTSAFKRADAFSDKLLVGIGKMQVSYTAFMGGSVFTM